MNISKDQLIYDKIFVYYFEDMLSIRKACVKLNICANTYNRICRRLNLKSAAKLNCNINLLNNKKQIFSSSDINNNSTIGRSLQENQPKRENPSLLDRAISSEIMLRHGGSRNKNIVVERIFQNDKKTKYNNINERQESDDENSDEEFLEHYRKKRNL